MHRRQEYVKVNGVEPSQEPAVSESTLSTVLPPKICGVTRKTTASAVTAAVTSEF